MNKKEITLIYVSLFIIIPIALMSMAVRFGLIGWLGLIGYALMWFIVGLPPNIFTGDKKISDKGDQKEIKADELCWLKDHTYPFYFKRVSKNGKPILWGDFSSGMIKSFEAYIESEVEWSDIIYPIPSNPIR